MNTSQSLILVTKLAIYQLSIIISKDTPVMSGACDTALSAIQLVPIKTLQSLHAKFGAINESFETNLDCTIITRD